MIKQKVLHLIPYKKIFPPMNGGALRCFNILNQLSLYFDVDVISYQDLNKLKNQEIYYFPNNVKCFNPSSFARKKHPLELIPRIGRGLYHRWLRKSIRGPSGDWLVDIAHILAKLLKERNYNFVVLEHLECLMISPYISSLSPNTLQVIDLHNIDHKLLEKKHPYYNRIKKRESTLSNEVDLFFACSQLDKEELLRLNNNKLTGYVIPNGVEVRNKPFAIKKNKSTYNQILFCGSLDYAPNKNGLLWFFENVWEGLVKIIPNIQLNIVGKGASDYLNFYKKKSNVNFIGEVECVNLYYHHSYIAIVPLFNGSGTRLKVLEAMSLGNPVISTSKGAEGIDYINNEHLVIANDAQSFLDNILRINNNPLIAETLRLNARKLVEEKYSWEKIGRALKLCLDK